MSADFYRFVPTLKTYLCPLVAQKNWTDQQLKNTPMLFSAGIQFALDNGGELTRRALAGMPLSWAMHANELVIDTRVHMLMPGWYPCIPGWHHDDVARGADGQPDYDNLSQQPKHLLLLVNADVAPTEFITKPVTLPKVPGVVYGHWNRMLNEMRPTQLGVQQAIGMVWHEFDWQTFHRGVPAKKNGWRWFIRVTRGSKRPKLNEVRKQVQVYLPEPEAGW